MKYLLFTYFIKICSRKTAQTIDPQPEQQLRSHRRTFQASEDRAAARRSKLGRSVEKIDRNSEKNGRMSDLSAKVRWGCCHRARVELRRSVRVDFGLGRISGHTEDPGCHQETGQEQIRLWSLYDVVHPIVCLNESQVQRLISNNSTNIFVQNLSSRVKFVQVCFNSFFVEDRILRIAP